MHKGEFRNGTVQIKISAKCRSKIRLLGEFQKKKYHIYMYLEKLTLYMLGNFCNFPYGKAVFVQISDEYAANILRTASFTVIVRFIFTSCREYPAYKVVLTKK